MSAEPGRAARLYPARPFLAASVAVIRDGRVLLALRANPPGGARYALPGGLVEPGEMLAEAALRELREETGVEAEILGSIGHAEVIERDAEGHVRHHFVVCAHAALWRAGEGVAIEEAEALRWATLAEAEALPTVPGLPAILARAFALADGR